ncbi:MAG: CDP-diacylglycerol---serine O-phosphatidyltransferase [Solirubrobacteraceae bacterium]|jgi:CDP-diacylglycerol--serine O-phosphatidyltransferase|nr:CDP-diacylglycerol---serine O-phosphatidyltransferase [Solirubrobacteraceae bacterium]MEA2479455.1 CDP-diacylglycerol---serine O-phosphatidyltransferase [Thermoleophilaceae bacterium]
MNWPCALTAGSLAGGFLALILAAQGDIRWAAGVVVGCGVLDSVDGLLARRMSACSAFGAQLDSLADVVSFGVAPALMLYFGVLHGIPVVGLAACVGFVLCGAWRLARFALIADDRRFIGLPIPPAAVIAAGGAAWAPPAGIALALTVTLCALMVSDIPFPTLRTIGRLLTPRRAAEEESPATVLEVELDRTALSGSTSSPQRG